MKFFAITFSFFLYFNGFAQELSKLKVITPYYELYASSNENLLEGQKDLDYAINEFQKYFSKKFRPIIIVLFDSQAQIDSAVEGKNPEWNPFVKAKRYAMPMVAGQKLNGFNILTHEGAHMLLMTYADENWQSLFPTDSTPKDYYGHSYIPDWIDEAIAVLCERTDEKQNRRKHMRNSIEKRLPLSEVLLHRTQSGLFYEEILSIMEYIIEKEGNDIVEKIVEESIRKKTMEEILKQHAKNIPYKLDELEKEWVEWVKTK